MPLGAPEVGAAAWSISFCVADPQDKVDIEWLRAPGSGEGGARAPQEEAAGRRWLSIWFNCCSTYARIYKNRDGTMYEGGCPRCGGQVRALVGDGGTSRRMFETL